MVLVLSQRTGVRDTIAVLLSGSGMPVATASSVAGSLDMLQAMSTAVVVCDSDCPEGGWKAVLGVIEKLPRPPLLVVTSTHADDRLWAEVLNLGAYDVLAQPLDMDEVQRVLVHAADAYAARGDRVKRSERPLGGS